MKGLYPCGASGSAAEEPEPDIRPDAVDSAFDPEAARQHMGIDRANFGRIFEWIWCEVSERRSLLDAAYQAGDLQLVVLHAHTIKSSAASIGAQALSRAAAAVERAAGCDCPQELAVAMEAFHAAKETLCRLIGMR